MRAGFAHTNSAAGFSVCIHSSRSRVVRLTIHTLMIGVIAHTMCTRAAHIALHIAWNTAVCIVSLCVVLWINRSAQPSDVIVTGHVIRTSTMITMMYGVFSTSLFDCMSTALVLVAAAAVQWDRPATAVITRIVSTITICHVSVWSRVRLVAVGIHLPTTVSLTIASVVVIQITLLRGIIFFIRSARISISPRILTSL